jgi:hypothetical protein
MHGALAQSHSSSGEGLSSVREEQLSQQADDSDDSVVDAISEPLETPRRPAKKKAAGPVRRKKTASKKAAPPRKKAAKKRRPARVDDDLDFVDDDSDFVDDKPEEDYEDYDEAPRRRAGGGGGRRPNRGRGGRSRQDDYDDYDAPDDEYDGYDDYDDRPRRGGGGGGRSGGRRRGVALAQIAVLIVAIALCVRGGGHLLVVFSKLLIDLQSATSSSSLSTIRTMSKVALWLTFLADLALLGGYIVAIIAPSKGAGKAIAITCVSLCAVSTGLMFFFQILPSLEAGGRLTSMFGIQLVLSVSSPFVAVMKSFLLTVLFVAHMPMFAHYLKQAARDSAAMVPFFIALGWIGIQLLQAIVLLILIKSPSMGMGYFFNTVNWIGLVCLTVYFVLAIISAFKLRRKV